MHHAWHHGALVFCGEPIDWFCLDSFELNISHSDWRRVRQAQLAVYRD